MYPFGFQTARLENNSICEQVNYSAYTLDELLCYVRDTVGTEGLSTDRSVLHLTHGMHIPGVRDYTVLDPRQWEGRSIWVLLIDLNLVN